MELNDIMALLQGSPAAIAVIFVVKMMLVSHTQSIDKITTAIDRVGDVVIASDAKLDRLVTKAEE